MNTKCQNANALTPSALRIVKHSGMVEEVREKLGSSEGGGEREVSVRSVDVVDEFIVLPAAVVESDASWAQSVASRAWLVLALGDPVHCLVHLHEVLAVAGVDLTLSRVPILAATTSPPEVI